MLLAGYYGLHAGRDASLEFGMDCLDDLLRSYGSELGVN